MNWFKRNSVLGTGLLLGVSAVAAEGWFLQEARRQATQALAGLAQKTQERDWLARQSPALSEANEQAIEQDLAQAGQVLAALRVALQGRQGKPPDPPLKPIDAYFDIAAFVEKTRALATRAQVTIKPDERFGFATYAHEGPVAELVTAVFRQRMVAQYLVEALLESRPRALLGVQRERPRPADQREQDVGTEARDFGDFESVASFSSPGHVAGEIFRLEFTGQTPALRAFLNNLAALPQPVIVRSVAVEPLSTGESPDLSATPVALVAGNCSKFSVVVESVELPRAGEGSVP